MSKTLSIFTLKNTPLLVVAREFKFSAIEVMGFCLNQFQAFAAGAKTLSAMLAKQRFDSLFHLFKSLFRGSKKHNPILNSNSMFPEHINYADKRKPNYPRIPLTKELEKGGHLTSTLGRLVRKSTVGVLALAVGDIVSTRFAEVNT